ncbi:MAG: multidrug efflux RND transporter permease subunit [Pseudomonadota bacterium]
MFVDFFIKRPVFACVIAILIVLAGLICIPILPVAQFPQIAPPVVQVTATYTGASAEVLEQTVTSPLEEQINGVEGMTYMSSMSSNDGTATINVTFKVGYDLDIAAVDVQNRVDIALPRLPQDVRSYGVTTQKKSTNLVLAINLFSPDNTFDDLYLSNYADINIVDVLKRIPGMGDVTIMGERKYSMRLWLDPDKLASMGMTASDVINAVKDQNLQVAAGSIGQPPSPPGQVFQYTVTTKGRLSKPEEFENIILRSNNDGTVVYIKDVASVEMGAENYQWYTNMNGKKTTMIGVYQLPDANSVDIANAVKETMSSLSKHFPKGMNYKIAYDTTMFVIESIKEVIMTLVMAMFLVFLVIYIFLQDWRSTLIPAITIPVSLIGTFGLMMVLGFSINTLTLFGLVLAIGTVVDDAIVVVENISRLIEEEGMEPLEAASKGMSEVVGPVIATTLVLFAVFVPVAFIPGISGQLYKQFALTIACAVGISTINALTLSPALCAILLRPKSGGENFLFKKFNQGMEWSKFHYHKLVGIFINKWRVVMIVFLGMIAVTYLLFRIVPTGFLPDEDQGYFFMLAQGPDGSSLERTDKIATQIEKILGNTEGVSDVLTIGGYNIINGGLDPSASSFFVVLNPWDDRTSEDLSLNAIMSTIYMKTLKIEGAMVIPFNPPPISGLSTTGGFQFELQDREGNTLDRLSAVTQKMIDEAKKEPSLTPLSTSFRINYPQIYIDLDRTKTKVLGIQISDVFNTLQAYLGSLYVNDFNRFGRVYRVYAQAKKNYRSDMTDIARLYVRNNQNEMIPLSALAQVKEIRGVQSIKHYNVYRAVELNGANTSSYSSGQAINAMQSLADRVLPDGFGFEWTGVAFEELQAGNMAPLIFTLALIFVFLFLAAQYESWSMPLMVMFAVPLAMLGALTAQWLRSLNNDVYCQIGLVMLIGIASKNAILLIEFAKDQRTAGKEIVESALLAAKIRLRPILMTAFSFILGVLPLVLAKGAGAASRHSLGTAVMGGMIASTFLSLGLVPVFYVLIETVREEGLLNSIRKAKKK